LTNLVQQAKGAFSRIIAFADPVFQTGGILVDQDAYTTGLDRIYNTKGFSDIFVEVSNDGANGLSWEINKCRREYSDISTLVNADFNEDAKAEANVAASANDSINITSVTPEITAIRVRLKRQTASMNTTVSGIVSAI